MELCSCGMETSQLRFCHFFGARGASARRRRNVSARTQLFQQCASPLQTDGNHPPTIVSAPDRRIVAVGDLHGDLQQTRRALRIGGITNDEDDWIGGTAVLVQVGDVLDRGGDEICILSLLQHLRMQARLHGGAVFQILGNHETMNVAQEFYDVSPSGFEESEFFLDYCRERHDGNWDAAFSQWRLDSADYKASKGYLPAAQWVSIESLLKTRRRIAARARLYRPGGPIALELARHSVVLVINGWLFAHGGVLPQHVKYGLCKINKEVSSWMKADGTQEEKPFIATKGYDSIVWSRLYSRRGDVDQVKACAVLEAALSATNAKALVVGHTPQTSGANSECDGKVWRIDVGMSSGVLNADPEVLEICGDRVQVLRELA